MSEQIAITISVEQAEALVDAVNCLGCATDGDLASILGVYMPESTPESGESDRYRRIVAERAADVREQLHEELKGVYRRDPMLQDMLHSYKMHSKYGRPKG